MQYFTVTSEDNIHQMTAEYSILKKRF